MKSAIASDAVDSVSRRVALCPSRDKINDHCATTSLATRCWQLSGALIPPTYRSASGLIVTPIKVVPMYSEEVMRLLMNLTSLHQFFMRFAIILFL